MNRKEYTFFAPGRVNLIGEHLDYNGGLVMPAAIDKGVTLKMKLRDDNKFSLTSDSHPVSKEFELSDNFSFASSEGWMNYPTGVIQHLKMEGIQLPGCDLFYSSTLPESSGLSSSAAIEVLTAYALLKMQNINYNMVWLAGFCKQVENEFIGVQCGIMDQYSIALGKANHALLLDCGLLRHQYVTFEPGDYRLVIMNTNKPRSLIHSKYNERRAECDLALDTIRNVKGDLRCLCDAEPYFIDVISDDVIRRRAKHVVTEQLRVKESARVLKMNDLSTFGRLMNASHQSLKDDYEVSGPELDSLVYAAQSIKGCLGARMTGAGFGGCAIALVNQTVLSELTDKVSDRYFSDTGLQCNIFSVNIADGVKQLN